MNVNPIQADPSEASSHLRLLVCTRIPHKWIPRRLLLTHGFSFVRESNTSRPTDFGLYVHPIQMDPEEAVPCPCGPIATTSRLARLARLIAYVICEYLLLDCFGNPIWCIFDSCTARLQQTPIGPIETPDCRLLIGSPIVQSGQR